ncbi:hypothetical protein PF011_g23388 [Phytophthora fragariae]|uniref:Transposase Tc1-like domain-containing protein n=1 Tax=Phytophthora fragariae TaxID=53985 RepID=A0A6A3I5K3_9STRA|nr:hypothetical protein PF011_g23388 [Phytophthora fragariae]
MLRRRFSAVKPRLTPTHKKRRLEFALRHVRQPRGLRQPRFVDLYDVTKAQRSSVNILSGDWETKNISMTSKEYAKMLMTKVFPAIRATWPGCKRRPIADRG